MLCRAQVRASSDAEPDPHPEHLFLSHEVSRGHFTGFCFNSSYISLNIRRQNYTIHSISGLHTLVVVKYLFPLHSLGTMAHDNTLIIVYMINNYYLNIQLIFK
jgi:hypothetical protein